MPVGDGLLLSCVDGLFVFGFMVFLILNVVSMKKYLSVAPQIADALFECGEYTDLASRISEGYGTYGKSFPPRGATKSQWLYMDAFGEFGKIDFSESRQKLRSLQSIVRRNRIYGLLICTLGITWVLQVPLFIFSSIYLSRLVG